MMWQNIYRQGSIRKEALQRIDQFNESKLHLQSFIQYF